MASDHSGSGEGSSRRKVLECMTWAGTGVLWTVSGGVPKSLSLLGRAEAAAQSLPNGRSLRWDDLERGFGAAELIVQATTLSMNDEGFEWPIANVRAGAIVADIVYRPLETGLLGAARERGLTAIDGLGMLIHQGVRSFELWFAIKPDAAKARARLMAALGETP